MKTKLRKITVDERAYLYHIRTDYYYTANVNKLTLTIFLNGEKRTPLVVDFLTLDDLYKGQPLNVGIELLNVNSNEQIRVNINEPKYIREFILLGIKNGWEGINKIPKQNGLEYLTEIGFDVSQLKPKDMPAWWFEKSVYKDPLIDATFPLADGPIEKQGTFSPMASVVTNEGTILNITANEAEHDLQPYKAVDNLKKMIKTGAIAGQYIACVILYPERVINLFENNTVDTVAIFYESTQETKRWIYFYPYRFTPKKKVAYSRSWATVADKEVFI
jgi:hypothetical protein